MLYPALRLELESEQRRARNPSALFTRPGAGTGTALNITKNAGAGDVQLSQVRLYDGHGSALKIRAAASPEWCHCPDAEAPAMATDDDGDGRLGLNTKWLCRADHAELSLTLAAPSAVTGCTLAWGLEPRARRCWRLICCCPG